MRQILMSLRDAKIGQTVRFVYAGGSNPGSVRTVKIEEKDSFSILGMDQDKGEYRQFYANRVNGSVEVLDTVAPVATRTISVHFTDARQQLHAAIDKADGEHLAVAFIGVLPKEATNVRFVSRTGTIEYEMPEPTFNVNGQTMTLTQLRELVAQHS